jgi:hypothetical protein
MKLQREQKHLSVIQGYNWHQRRPRDKGLRKSDQLFNNVESKFL